MAFFIMSTLLTRDQFRDGVFKRDSHKCVICEAPAQDAHHILERRLWPDGGYYLDNGASLCGACHLKAESTEIPCDVIRSMAGITKIILPPHLYKDMEYDKWGNPILPNGTRLRGELYDDASVQKVIAPMLGWFTKYVKYPRTYHLPWSPGLTKDDRQIESCKQFEGKRVIVTVKMDGENTTMYSDYCHARSLEYEPHDSRDWSKALHGRMGYEIPEGWRVCCENLYAKHAIHYQQLSSYVQGISIWNEKNVCLPWDETKEWFALLGLPHVRVLYDGIWDEKLIRKLYTPMLDGEQMEGYVVRLAESFHYSQFRFSVAKYVREGHVQPNVHNWKSKPVIPNKLQ